MENLSSRLVLMLMSSYSISVITADSHLILIYLCYSVSYIAVSLHRKKLTSL